MPLRKALGLNGLSCRWRKGRVNDVRSYGSYALHVKGGVERGTIPVVNQSAQFEVRQFE